MEFAKPHAVLTKCPKHEDYDNDMDGDARVRMQDQQQEIEEIERLQGELQKQEARQFRFRSWIFETWRHPPAWQLRAVGPSNVGA